MPRMILPLFLALLALALVVFILGYYTSEAPYLTVGLLFLFLLSIIILTGNLEYQTGETKNVTFTYNSTILTNQNETTSFTYTAWDDNTSSKVGWGLAVISFIGLTLSLYNTRVRKVNDDE